MTAFEQAQSRMSHSCDRTAEWLDTSSSIDSEYRNHAATNPARLASLPVTDRVFVRGQGLAVSRTCSSAASMPCRTTRASSDTARSAQLRLDPSTCDLRL
eukprot:6503003-Prymnesium_polylepis.4